MTTQRGPTQFRLRQNSESFGSRIMGIGFGRFRGRFDRDQERVRLVRSPSTI
jgi:hypothetical protein